MNILKFRFLEKLKKHIVVCVFLLASCAPVLAQTLTVDDETRNLIIESVDLELGSNSKLKDPLDSLPLMVNYSELLVLGKSVIVDTNNANGTNYEYAVAVPYETVDGEEESLLCLAKIYILNEVKEALKATCEIVADLNESDTGILFDEP